MVQALRAGPQVLERRERVLARLAAVVDEGRRGGCAWRGIDPADRGRPRWRGVRVVYARLSRGERGPLTGLLGELMGMIVLPYLGPAAARRERAVLLPPRRIMRSPRARSGAPRSARDPLEDVNMRLTYRTARVLEGVAELSGRGADPSNRQIADLAGDHRPGADLEAAAAPGAPRAAQNTGAGHAKGEPNEWKLTPLGRQVAQRLSVLTLERTEAA